MLRNNGSFLHLAGFDAPQSGLIKLADLIASAINGVRPAVAAMAHKQILFRSAAREKILRGASQLADAIRVTLGPRSKSVLIEKKWGAPIVCNDGVTIAKEFDLKDPEENLGARMLRQAAEKTGDMVGDGTSTATILAHAISVASVLLLTEATMTEIPEAKNERAPEPEMVI